MLGFKRTLEVALHFCEGTFRVILHFCEETLGYRYKEFAVARKNIDIILICLFTVANNTHFEKIIDFFLTVNLVHTVF